MRSPDRLLISVVRSAVGEGAVARNHVEAIELRRARDGARERIVGARVRTSDGELIDVHARVVLLAANAGANALVSGACARAIPPFARACNVIVQRPAPGAAIAIPVPRQTRMLYAVPWRDRLMIGTSQHPAGEDASDFDPAAAIESLLGGVNAAIPELALRADEVALVHHGLLPGTAAALLDRPLVIDHEARDGLAGLASMIGVKWTTARRTAERAVDVCAARLGVRTRGSTRDAGLAGSEFDSLETLIRSAQVEAGDIVERSVATRLAMLYGTWHRDVLAIARAEPALAHPLAPSVETIGAEVAHAMRTEWAAHLEDFVLRRTELGTAGHPGEAALRAAAAIASREAGWNAARVDQELARVRSRFP